MNLSQLIEDYSKQFKSDEIERTGEQKRTITVFADNASEALKNSVYKAHQESLPRDWIFSTYADILQALTGYTIESMEDVEEYRSEIVDNMVDVYTSSLTQWLADSIYNVEYLTQAIQELQPEDGYKLLSGAQYLAIDEVYGYVVELLGDTDHE